MLLDDYFEIGFILKPHGLKGALNIQLDVDDPTAYKKMESVIVKVGSNLIPFFISSLQINGKKGILSLEDVDSIDAATELNSCALLLPIGQLPKLGKNQFYYHEVIGYTIVDKTHGSLGILEQIISGGNQDLISMLYNEKEVLIPINDEIVSRADHSNKEVHVALPDGLLDIYLKA